LWGDDLNGDGYAEAIVSAALWRSQRAAGCHLAAATAPATSAITAARRLSSLAADLRGHTIDLATRIDQTTRPVDDSVTVIYGPTRTICW
jgi:hypothetical protein